jgi:hypothetical protein
MAKDTSETTAWTNQLLVLVSHPVEQLAGA